MKQYWCAAALVLIPALSFAQGNPGPYGGLFGRAPQRTGINSKVFEIRGSGGWQWNDFLAEPTPDQPQPPFAGSVGYSAAAAAYERRSDRLDLQAGSRVEFKNAFADRTRGTTVDGGLLLNGRLTTRVTTEAALSYRRSPFYQLYPTFSWTGDGLVMPAQPFEVRTIGYHAAEARVGGSWQYSKSSTLTASAARSELRLADTSPKSEVSIQSYNGLWTRRLNRTFSLRLGYGHRELQHTTTTVLKVIEEEIDAGVDFQRALTIAPRTTFGFMTRTSMVRRPNRPTLYRLNGEFRLMRFFNKTWRLQIDGRRSTEVLAGFSEPLFVDSLSVSTGGLLSQRLEWATTVSGQHGQFGYEAGGPGPVTMAGATTHLMFAVARRLGVFGQYGFYHHNAPLNALSITALGEVSRQTLTVGIMTWLPVYTRERDIQ